METLNIEGTTSRSVESSTRPARCCILWYQQDDRTIKKIKRFWPGMVIAIRNYVAQCAFCRMTKSPNTILRPPMSIPMTSDRPFQKLYIEILGPYPRSKKGNIGLLIIVDHFSKFHFLQPLRKFTAIKICM